MCGNCFEAYSPVPWAASPGAARRERIFQSVSPLSTKTLNEGIMAIVSAGTCEEQNHRLFLYFFVLFLYLVLRFTVCYAMFDATHMELKLIEFVAFNP